MYFSGSKPVGSSFLGTPETGVLRPGKVPVPDVLVEKAFRRHQWSWQGLDPLGRKTNRKRKAYDAWLQTSVFFLQRFRVYTPEN